MSTLELMRVFFALLFGGLLAWGIYSRYDPEMRGENEERPGKRYAPVIAPTLLPMYLLMLLLMLAYVTDRRYTLTMMGSMCLELFLLMSLYYVILTALNPLLRRWISARTCAALWLLPNFLYITQQSFMRREMPRWIIPLEGEWIRWAALLWISGMICILLWKALDHIRFRRSLKKASRPEEDPELLEQWVQLQKSVGIKKAKLRLYRTDALASPLSVGVFRAATFVVLPERHYAPEELKLILRHELVHILRCDGQTKLFLTFCTAMCWLNPLMWLAVARSSEDLELSCDELVLEYANAEEKRRYADLILGSAGESRGFTSCLSATANSLRYRLKQIVNPGRRRVGGITAGLAFFLLLLCSGLVGFSYGSGTVRDVAFAGDDTAVYSFDSVQRGVISENSWRETKSYSCDEPDALLDYIFSLPVARLGGNFDFPAEEEFLDILLEAPDAPVYLSLTSEYCKISRLSGDRHGTETYQMQVVPDWEYLDAMLTEIVFDPIPEPQDLLLDFGPEVNPDGEYLCSSGAILENLLNGEPSEKYSLRDSSSSCIDGFPAKEVLLRFSDGLLPTELTIMARDLEREEETGLFPEEDDDGYRLELMPYSARYTVEALFVFGTDLGEQIYRMQYEFDVILPDPE